MYWHFTFAFFAWQQGDIGDSGLPGEKGDQGTKVTNPPLSHWFITGSCALNDTLLQNSSFLREIQEAQDLVGKMEPLDYL